MKTFPKFRITTAILATLACGGAVASPPAEPSTTVRYGDLNLKSPEGIATLYRRIAHAATRVCELPRGTRQLKFTAEIRACERNSTDRAVLQANLPALSALHLAKTGRSVGASQYADRR